jgi:hypothetical protein
VTAVPRDAAAPAPKPVTVPTSIPDAIAPPPTVDPALERDEADASERVSAPPAPEPQLVAPDPVVAIPASLVAMPEGLAYPHVVGTGTPGATIEVLVDYTGSPTLLTGVVGASGGFKIDAIVTAVVGDQWAIARQVVGGVASDWSDPFKVTIPPPPTLTWAWAGADKVTITAVAVTPFAPIYIVIDGVLAGTFTPAGPSGDLVVFPTSTLTPVVTATYSTGTESAPIATVPQH